jgi:hypothetical protein
MAEYAQRRAAVMNIPYFNKKSQNIQPTSSSDIPLYADIPPLEEEVTSLSIVGGWRNSLGCVDFSLAKIIADQKLGLSMSPHLSI